MRSHVTMIANFLVELCDRFQYRKRYEVTCDIFIKRRKKSMAAPFQYRKRYEVTCDFKHKEENNK